MYKVQISTTANKLTRMVCAAVAIAAVAVALIASPAQADPKGGTGTAKGCPIENNGKPETVAVGSRVGMFVCGSDGEWHFGWLITRIAAPPHRTVKPVAGGVIRNGVLRAAKAYR